MGTTRRCRSLTYQTPETEQRAIRIGSTCHNCVCERCSVGKHGSPGRVRSGEVLYSVVIAPADLKADQIAVTMVTHAERKGMSVLRGDASISEFKKIIADRVKGDGQRKLHGIASLPCSSLRMLAAQTNTGQRLQGDRLYCALDSDMPGLPHHADVFATVPRPFEGKAEKTAWRAERARLLLLLQQSITAPDVFRDGLLREP